MLHLSHLISLNWLCEFSAAREAHKAAVLAQKKLQKQQEEALRRRQAAVAQLAQSRADKAKVRLATVQGARLPASGSVVGVFDPVAYNQLNGTSGDGWRHFLSSGFNDGCLLTVTTPVGLFAGIFDAETYLHRNSIEPVALDQPPFHPQQQAYTDLQSKTADILLPIKPAVVVSVFGRFSTGLYYQANPDAGAYAHKPTGGAFDGAMYLKIHRDIGRVDPLDHYINHVGGHVMMRR